MYNILGRWKSRFVHVCCFQENFQSIPIGVVPLGKENRFYKANLSSTSSTSPVRYMYSGGVCLVPLTVCVYHRVIGEATMDIIRGDHTTPLHLMEIRVGSTLTYPSHPRRLTFHSLSPSPHSLPSLTSCSTPSDSLSLDVRCMVCPQSSGVPSEMPMRTEMGMYVCPPSDCTVSVLNK